MRHNTHDMNYVVVMEALMKCYSNNGGDGGGDGECILILLVLVKGSAFGWIAFSR